MLDRPFDPETDAAQVPAEDQALLDAYSRAVIDVADRVGPAVVRLDVNLIRLLTADKIGRAVEIATLRGGKMETVTVVPGERTRKR